MEGERHEIEHSGRMSPAGPPGAGFGGEQPGPSSRVADVARQLSPDVGRHPCKPGEELG